MPGIPHALPYWPFFADENMPLRNKSGVVFGYYCVIAACYLGPTPLLCSEPVVSL